MNYSFIILGIRIITIILAVWYLSNVVSFEHIKNVRADVQGVYLYPVALLSIVIMGLHSWRFKNIVKPNQERFWPIWHGIAQNNLYNLILPLRGGDFIRAKTLSKNLNYFQFFGYIILEKLIDLGCYVTIFLSVYFLSINIWPACFVIIAMAIFGYRAFAPVVLQRINNNHKNIIIDKLYQFKSGLHPKWNIFETVIIIFTTILLRLLEVTVAYFMMKACGVDLSWGVIIAVQSIIFMSLVIPAAPAFIGTYHAVAIFALTQYGVTVELAAIYAIISHLYLMAFGFSFGLTSLPFVQYKIADKP